MIRFAKDFFKDSLKRCGLSVRRFPPIDDQRIMRNNIMNELKIDVVLDVGANEGQYGREIREFGYQKKIVSFEPMKKAFSDLRACSGQDKQWETRNVGLGNSDGTSDIHLAGVFSSMLQRDDSQASPPCWPDSAGGVETIQIARLDTLAGEVLPPGARPWLKIDVQGFEIKVLEGAVNTLPKVSAIEVEVSLSRIYKDQPLMLDVLNYLKSFDFEAINLYPFYGDIPRGRTLQSDVILSRNGVQ